MSKSFGVKSAAPFYGISPATSASRLSLPFWFLYAPIPSENSGRGNFGSLSSKPKPIRHRLHGLRLFRRDLRPCSGMDHLGIIFALKKGPEEALSKCAINLLSDQSGRSTL